MGPGAAISNDDIRRLLGHRSGCGAWRDPAQRPDAFTPTPAHWVAQIAALAQTLGAVADGGWFVARRSAGERGWDLVGRRYETRSAAQGRATRISNGGTRRAYVVSVHADDVIVWASRDHILGDFPRHAGT
jgi:hypothetical protein